MSEATQTTAPFNADAFHYTTALQWSWARARNLHDLNQRHPGLLYFGGDGSDFDQAADRVEAYLGIDLPPACGQDRLTTIEGWLAQARTEGLDDTPAIIARVQELASASQEAA